MRTLLVALLAAVTLFAGCTGDDKDDDRHGGDDAAPIKGDEDVTAVVVAGSPDEFRFQPSILEVREGERVALVFRNEGTTLHEIHFMAFDFELDAPAGGAAGGAFTAPAAGQYEYACHIPGHAEAGMVGTLNVLPPEA